MERGQRMDQQQRTKRFGIYVILCACILRLSMAGTPESVRRLRDENDASFLTYLETGRNVRFSASSAVFSDYFRESPPPWIPKTERPQFTAADA